MNRFLRRGLLGALAAIVAGLPLAFLHAMSLPEFVVAAVAGALYAMCFPPNTGAYADNMMASASLGIPLWGVTNGILIPFLSGHPIAWDAAAMKSNFAQLLSWILFGAVLGALLQLFSQLAAIWFGLELVPAATTPTNVKRIVILGGGFAGMKTAGSLEEQFDGDNGVSISLVSETNALLFTPMLRDTS